MVRWKRIGWLWGEVRGNLVECVVLEDKRIVLRKKRKLIRLKVFERLSKDWEMLSDFIML